MTFVFLHGFTGGPELFDSLRRRVDPGAFCPPVLGHGARSNGVRTFDGEVDRLAQLVRSEGFEGATVLGYSLGSRLALGMIVRHPKLFSSAVLVGVNPGIATPPEREARLDDDRRWIDLLEGGDVDSFARAWEAQPIFASQIGARSADLAQQRATRRAHDPRELARAMKVLGLGAMPNYWPRLPSVEIPVLFVAGELDAKFGAIAERARAETPASRVVRVRGAGHNPILEAPSAIAALLRREGRPS
jgi:2-succinyl-6-hydroxy-2,4-cyclohexadiene-1-carboxylate synthase